MTRGPNYNHRTSPDHGIAVAKNDAYNLIIGCFPIARVMTIAGALNTAKTLSRALLPRTLQTFLGVCGE